MLEIRIFFSGIFTSFCSILGLLWESGGMAGRQQAPAGNHRHGHLGSAGRWFGDKWFFPSSICFASLPFLFPFLLCVCFGAFVCVCLSSNKLEKRKKKKEKNVCIQWPLWHHPLLRKLWSLCSVGVLGTHTIWNIEVTVFCTLILSGRITAAWLCAKQAVVMYKKLSEDRTVETEYRGAGTESWRLKALQGELIDNAPKAPLLFLS